MLDFLPTARARQGRPDLDASPPPAPGLVDRRVEITGPTDPKMTINALNSGAKVWLADLEDANTPHWDERGRRPAQPVRRDSTARSTSPRPTARHYRLATDDQLATIVVRPRGWHLDEKHLLVDGAAACRRAGRLRRCTSSTTRRAASSQGQRPVLLPAEDGEPPRGPAVERRLHLRAGRARHPARHDPRHRAHRDHPGRLRDGRDPLRAARARRRPERRPLGLPVQRDQELPRRRARTSCCRTATR